MAQRCGFISIFVLDYVFCYLFFSFLLQFLPLKKKNESSFSVFHILVWVVTIFKAIIQHFFYSQRFLVQTSVVFIVYLDLGLWGQKSHVAIYLVKSPDCLHSATEQVFDSGCWRHSYWNWIVNLIIYCGALGIVNFEITEFIFGAFCSSPIPVSLTSAPVVIPVVPSQLPVLLKVHCVLLNSQINVQRNLDPMQ